MKLEEKLQAAHSALLAGDPVQAERLYRCILDDQPGDLRALDGLGVLFCQRNDFVSGIDCFQQAIQLAEGTDPASQAVLLFHLGLSQREQGRCDEAIESFRMSLNRVPDVPDVLLNLGQLYHERNRFDEAIDSFRLLASLQPENASAWLTLGYLLSHQNRFEQAIDVLVKAVHLDATSPEACFYLAESLRQLERHEESLPYYHRLLQVGTEWPQAVYGYGKSLLALGYLEDGWDAMEFRLVGSFGSWQRHFLPNWNPTATDRVDRETTVLAYSEEGIGADIMYASCLPDLVDAVDHCVVECDEALHGLFRRSFPRIDLVPLATEDVGPDRPTDPAATIRDKNPWGRSLDEQIALGSLPRFFRRSCDRFPFRKAYLVPDRDRVEKWSVRLTEIGSVKKIGFLWQGSWTAETERQTTLPLPELRDLMLRHQGDAAWISLQQGSRQKDLDPYRRNVSIHVHRFKEAFQYDLDEMAALLTALDLVITPPGHLAHLAGALGVRTWLVLPERADWRWNLGSKEVLWHPTVRTYRRTAGRAWSELFETIERDLRELLKTHRPPQEREPTILAFPNPEQEKARPPVPLRRVA